MTDETRKKFVVVRARIIARAKEEAKKKRLNLRYLLFGEGSKQRMSLSRQHEHITTSIYF